MQVKRGTQIHAFFSFRIFFFIHSMYFRMTYTNSYLDTHKHKNTHWIIAKNYPYLQVSATEKWPATAKSKIGIAFTWNLSIEKLARIRLILITLLNSQSQTHIQPYGISFFTNNESEKKKWFRLLNNENEIEIYAHWKTHL